MVGLEAMGSLHCIHMTRAALPLPRAPLTPIHPRRLAQVARINKVVEKLRELEEDLMKYNNSNKDVKLKQVLEDIEKTRGEIRVPAPHLRPTHLHNLDLDLGLSLIAYLSALRSRASPWQSSSSSPVFLGQIVSGSLVLFIFAETRQQARRTEKGFGAKRGQRSKAERDAPVSSPRTLRTVS